MKYLVCLLLILTSWSCRKENFQKVNAEQIAKKELKHINFSEVDQFPLFKTCDETANRQAQQHCFEQEFHVWLKPHLDSIPYKNTTDDTIQLNLSVDSKGKINLDSLASKMELTETFQNIFKQSPQIYPAQKRGVPVKVSFQMPVILKIKPH